jgi:hypothetical protein
MNNSVYTAIGEIVVGLIVAFVAVWVMIKIFGLLYDFWHWLIRTEDRLLRYLARKRLDRMSDAELEALDKRILAEKESDQE